MNREPLRIFIGYDSREPVAWHVLAHSILRRATVPVSLIPLRQDALRSMGIYTRERGRTESTEFSLTRFLVPYLSGYWGTSIFMDCDMLMRVDVADLMAAVGRADTAAYKSGHVRPALFCCQHSYEPTGAMKFLGNVQTVYPRKNWSSLMVFRNGECADLTPEYVNRATGLELHRFQWLNDRQIAGLPLEWNWLVGEYPASAEAKVLHWTLGGPWFPEYAASDHADEWRAELLHLGGTPMPGMETAVEEMV